MGKILCFILLFHFGASADVLVDIQNFNDATTPSKCNVLSWWGPDVLKTLRERIETSLKQTPGLHVVDAEKGVMYRPALDPNVNMIHKTGRYQNSKYSIRGTILVFDYCGRRDADSPEAQVTIAIVLKDNKTGEAVESFVSQISTKESPGREPATIKAEATESGAFKESAIGRALSNVVADASSRIVKYFPANELNSAPENYKVKLINSTRGS